MEFNALWAKSKNDMLSIRPAAKPCMKWKYGIRSLMSSTEMLNPICDAIKSSKASNSSYYYKV